MYRLSPFNINSTCLATDTAKRSGIQKKTENALNYWKKKQKIWKKSCQVLFVGNQIMDGTYFWKCAHVLRITQSMVQAPRARWVDIDAISYTT